MMIRTRYLTVLCFAFLIGLAGCDAENPVGVERSDLLAGDASARAQTLSLSSICAGIWRVDNASATEISFRWQHMGTREEGMAIVAGNGTVYFRAPHVAGTNRVRIFIGQRREGDVISNNAECGYELVGSVYNDTDGSGSRGVLETGLDGLTVFLRSGGMTVASSRTDVQGAFQFNSPQLRWGTEYEIAIPATTAEDDNNEVIIPYYFNTFPASLPYTFVVNEPPGLANVGDYATSYGSETLDVGLILDPEGLKRAFDGGTLDTDTRDDQFWWEQMKRALNGEGAQNNADVPNDELLRLLMLIQNGGPGIDPFYDDPFQFGENPFATAERILSESRNRNEQQPDFLSALLTVWLNRVYLTNINTTLLDGLLLAAEKAYQDERVQTVAGKSTTHQAYSTAATLSTDSYTDTLTSTYRSGSGGIGSN
jgi:hypothetical protein